MLSLLTHAAQDLLAERILPRRMPRETEEMSFTQTSMSSDLNEFPDQIVALIDFLNRNAGI